MHMKKTLGLGLLSLLVVGAAGAALVSGPVFNAGAAVGDTVTIFGEDPTASELAGILGTIPYEIFTSIPRRIDRIVIR